MYRVWLLRKESTTMYKVPTIIKLWILIKLNVFELSPRDSKEAIIDFERNSFQTQAKVILINSVTPAEIGLNITCTT